MKRNNAVSLKSNIAWNSWGNTAYLASQWFLTILVARFLGYESAGVYGLAMSITNICYAIGIFGMRNYQVSDISGKYSHGNYVLSRYITGIAATIFCTVFVLANRYPAEQTLCIIIYMIFRLSEIMFDVYSGIYQINWRLDYAGKSQIMRAALLLAVFVAVSWATKSLLWAMASLTVAAFAVLTIYDRRCLRQLGPISLLEDRKKVPSLLLECTPFMIGAVLYTIVGSIPRYLMEFQLGSEELGVYASVAAPTLIVQVAASYVFTPLLTVFAKQYQTKDRIGFSKTLSRCLLVVAGLSVVALVGVKLVGRWGLTLLYGESIADYEYLLIPLIVCTILTALVWLLHGLLTVLHEPRTLVIGNAVSAVASAISSYFLIPRFGMQGASYAQIIALLLGTIIMAARVAIRIKKMSASQRS